MSNRIKITNDYITDAIEGEGASIPTTSTLSYIPEAKHLILIGLEITDPCSIIIGEKVDTLIIRDCGFLVNLTLQGNPYEEQEQSRKIAIVSSNIGGDFTVDNVHVNDVTVDNCIISDHFEVRRCKIGVHQVTGCQINHSIYEDGSIQDIRLMKNVTRSLQLFGTLVPGNIISFNEIYNESFNINDLKSSSTNISISSMRTEHFSIKDTNVNKLEISSIDVKLPLSFVSTAIDTIEFRGRFEGSHLHSFTQNEQKKDNLRVDHLGLYLEKGTVSFHSFSFKSITMGGYFQSGNILLRGISAPLIQYENFVNRGTITWSDLHLKNIQPIFNCIDSDLGNHSFLNLNWNKFKKLRIESSNWLDIKYSNVSWFASNVSENSSEQKELMRQLKVACLKNGDKITSLQFQSLELSAHLKTLKLKKGKRMDRILLSIGSVSKFGQDPLLPILISALISLILFIIIIYINHDQLQGKFGEFIMFLSPAHKMSQIGIPGPISDIHGGILFTDFLQRVQTSIFLYQIIRSFRKFVTK